MITWQVSGIEYLRLSPDTRSSIVAAESLSAKKNDAAFILSTLFKKSEIFLSFILA